MTETASAFHVKHEQFEGPLEVLLELIEKRKLFVNDISLAAVTDDFIAYIQTKGMLPDQVAHFLSVAATLILIKARSLLPNLELSEDEERSIGELERRIALYQIISEAAGDLIKKYGKKISFEGPTRPFAPVFAPDNTLTLATLQTLITDMEARVPVFAPKKPEARVYTTISITEVLATLHERMEKALSCTFKDIAVASPDGNQQSQKIYTIVSFLGMLEMVRRGFVDASQESLFDDIHLTRESSNEPLKQ
ncbi:MAG TPA: ScpA family protein [Candidatus Paceibacterota bacterium]|nr:ScpA family protein [Candidatus Paceibacterota bacterium]